MLKPTIIFLLYFCISVANISAQKINPALENQQRQEYENALKAEQFLKAEQYEKVDSGHCLYVVKCAVVTSNAGYHKLLDLYKQFENGKLNNKNLVLSLTMSTQDLVEAYSGENSRNINYLLLKAQILYEGKKFDDAKKKVFTVLQIDPENTEALKLYKDLGSPKWERYKPFDIAGKYVLSESRINLEDIYQKLENKKKIVRDEFETTAQFNKRRQEDREAKFLDDLKLNDYFEVPVERLIGISPTIQYSADDGRMDISFSLNNYTVNQASKYRSQEDYRILFNNSSDFDIYRKTLSWSDEIKRSLYFIPEVAKDVKPNLAFLAVIKFKEPYVEPLACINCSHIINADLYELWIYDKRTGYVYEKILNIPDRLSRAQAQFDLHNYKEALNILNFIFPLTVKLGDIQHQYFVLKGKNYIELKKLDAAINALNLANLLQETNLITNGRPYTLSLQKYQNLLTSIAKISVFNKNFPNAGINPESYLLLTKLYKQKKDKTNAIKTTNGLLKFYPKLSEALILKREILISK